MALEASMWPYYYYYSPAIPQQHFHRGSTHHGLQRDCQTSESEEDPAETANLRLLPEKTRRPRMLHWVEPVHDSHGHGLRLCRRVPQEIQDWACSICSPTSHWPNLPLARTPWQFWNIDATCNNNPFEPLLTNCFSTLRTLRLWNYLLFFPQNFFTVRDVWKFCLPFFRFTRLYALK